MVAHKACEILALWNLPYFARRAAFAITDVFLNINGYEIDITSRNAITKIDQLFATNIFDMAHLEPWLRKIIKARPR
jgi:death-on-curing protein